MCNIEHKLTVTTDNQNIKIMQNKVPTKLHMRLKKKKKSNRHIWNNIYILGMLLLYKQVSRF